MYEKDSVTVSQMLEVSNDSLVPQLHQFMLLLKMVISTHKISLGGMCWFL